MQFSKSLFQLPIVSCSKKGNQTVLHIESSACSHVKTAIEFYRVLSGKKLKCYRS